MPNTNAATWPKRRVAVEVINLPVYGPRTRNSRPLPVSMGSGAVLFWNAFFGFFRCGVVSRITKGESFMTLLRIF